MCVYLLLILETSWNSRKSWHSKKIFCIVWSYEQQQHLYKRAVAFAGFGWTHWTDYPIPKMIFLLKGRVICGHINNQEHPGRRIFQFLKRTEEFNTMMYFIKHFGLSMDSISKTKAQLAAEILGGNNSKGESSWKGCWISSRDFPSQWYNHSPF